jgi:hypothetical protein
MTWLDGYPEDGLNHEVYQDPAKSYVRFCDSPSRSAAEWRLPTVAASPH